MKIAIAGMGYVGLSQAVLLAQHNSVCVVDVAAEKVDMLNRGISPIQDSYLDAYLNKPHLRLRATLDPEDGYSGAEYVVIAVPTDFNPRENAFDTAMVESVIRQVLRYAPEAVMVIKSTVPVGFTQSMQSKYPAGHILVSPEFLREGKALYDNLYPSRIIVGTDLADPVLTEQAHAFARLLQEGAEKKNVELLVTGCGEAETIKLFANTYLALRIGFFNELDTFAELRGLDTGSIIHGICQDPRIGQYYNNPSFGYGGYCLPTAGQLPGDAPDADRGRRVLQRLPQKLHRPADLPSGGDAGLPGEQPTGGGDLSSDHEVRIRQLPVQRDLRCDGAAAPGGCPDAAV